MSEIRNIPFSPPDITEAEIEAVSEVLRSGWITTGPKTKEFERKIAEYCGTEKAVCLNSATAAMELTLRILGVGPGDEVITSAYTYTASASVIHHVGAKIVLVDTAPDSFEMDYDQMEKAITNKTKVIIPVDIAGVMCDYEQIFEIVNRQKNKFSPNNELQKNAGRIIVLADAAHSFGAIRNRKHSGQSADFSTFSFHAVKNLTTAEGGAVTWKNTFGLQNEELYREYMLLSLHGQSKDALAKTKGSWEYDIVYPGFKCNMTDIMAAIGLVQLSRYESLLTHRTKIYNEYVNSLRKDYVVPITHPNSSINRSSFHLMLIDVKVDDKQTRNKMITYLAEHGIACNVHFKPLCCFTAYKNLGFDDRNFPNSVEKFSKTISLPLNTGMTSEDVEYIVGKVNLFFSSEVYLKGDPYDFK